MFQKLLQVVFIFSAISSYGQYFSNPSFEGPVGMSLSPPGWYPCNDNSTPDTHPTQGAWNFTYPASQGSTYLGLVMRGVNGAINDNQAEAAGTNLAQPFLNGICYSVTIDLATFPGAEFNTGFDLIRYDHPGHLLIWGSRANCGKEKLLWKSPLISNSEWKSFTFPVNPEMNYTNLVFEADYADRNNKAYGNIIMDNLRVSTTKLDLGVDKTICDGTKVLLGSADAKGTFLWSNGSVQQQIEVSKKGTYWLQVFNGGCVLRDTITINKIDPFTLNLGKDLSLCTGDTHEIDVTISNGIYHWNTGSNKPKVIFKEPGKYEVTVDNGCETHTDEISISYREDCCGLDAPNVFTPNDDAFNNQFEITTEADLISYDLRIFNRWGQLVFHSDTIDKYWDGNANNQEAASGVYFWISSIQCLHKKQTQKKIIRGEVSLIR